MALLGSTTMPCMRTPSGTTCAALVTTVCLVACGVARPTPRADLQTGTTMTNAEERTSAAWPALLPQLLDDAAQRSGVARERLHVASAQTVTWPDGALGCPQPGRLYTQALVPGWRVVIAAPGAAALLYHGSERGGWLYCPADRATPALPGSSDPRV
jgi:hypothetical protein